MKVNTGSGLAASQAFSHGHPYDFVVKRKTRIRSDSSRSSSQAINHHVGVDSLHPVGVECLHPMNKPAHYQNRIELLQGPLGMLVLQALRWGAQHGYGISQSIHSGSSDVLQVETGSLYPALHRLER